MATATDTPGLFSIVVIAYNSEPFLTEAVRSALAQTHDPIEVIVVDDGSREPVAETLPAEIVPRVRIVRQPNGGIAAARNAGIAVARGEFVALLDGDDMMMPNHCAEAFRLFRARPEVEVLSQNSLFLSPQKKYDGAKMSDRFSHARPVTLQSYIGWRSNLSGTATFRRRVFTDVMMLDPEFRRGGEDIHLFLTLLNRGVTIDYIDEPTYIYRRHDSSITFSDDVHIRAVSIRAMDKVLAAETLSPADRAAIEAKRQSYRDEIAFAHYRQAFVTRDFARARQLGSDLRLASLPLNSRLKTIASLAVARLAALAGR